MIRLLKEGRKKDCILAPFSVESDFDRFQKGFSGGRVDGCFEIFPCPEDDMTYERIMVFDEVGKDATKANFVG
jgi:hypothetical protein